MPFRTRYLFAASMDVEPDRQDIFNEVYDKEHIPMLKEVPGVVSIARFKTQDLVMVMGGQRQAIAVENEPRFSALYEIESPQVLVSDAWAAAIDSGRWPTEVRPYTKNRRHVLHRLIFSS